MLHLLFQIGPPPPYAGVDQGRPGRKNEPPQDLRILHQGELYFLMDLALEFGLEAGDDIAVEGIGSPKLSPENAPFRIIKFRVEAENRIEISDPPFTEEKLDEV